jgi:Ca-activated chloride channel family protein
MSRTTLWQKSASSLPSRVVACAILLTVAALGILTSAATAFQGHESAGNNQQDSFRIVSDTELVLIDVGVKDTRGGFVRGLTKQNFMIEEGGKRRPITSFSAGDQPVTIGLVLDRSGSMRNKWQEVLAASGKLAASSNPQDEFYVVTFADDVALNLPPGVPFTDNVSALRRSLIGLPFGGRTALYDGLIAALSHLPDGRHERKALVLLSDGGDNASSVARAAALQAAERSHATIYAIGIFDSADEDADPRFLMRLAHATGGEAFFPKEWNQLSGISDRIAADIRARYTIGFTPADKRLDNTTRKFKVSVADPEGKRKVQSRTQYTASRRELAPAGR